MRGECLGLRNIENGWLIPGTLGKESSEDIVFIWDAEPPRKFILKTGTL